MLVFSKRCHHTIIEQQKSHIAKCIDVVKRLLKEKCSVEKKEARQKCMQNRLRLGQFVVQRNGSTLKEKWTKGYAFQELERRRAAIAAERKDLDCQKKLLRKNNIQLRQQQQQQQNGQTNFGSFEGNSDQIWNLVRFCRPDRVSDEYAAQKYYEHDEILRLRQNALKKEDADLELELENLELERNLHLRELRRILNEDQSRLNNHPVLNDRYLLLMLLGKGGYSEVYKAFDLKEQCYAACKVHQLNKDWREDKKANYFR
ncbi:hypothetical protein KR044_009141 [Drosophila immigrans]|nr:hypothetical protein KR044_009141 [Drosophila immigrans]